MSQVRPARPRLGADWPLLSAAISAPPPRWLFHYTSLDGVRGVVTSKAVWATAAQYLNDTKELRLALDIARGQFDVAARNAPDPAARWILQYYRHQLDRMEGYGVCVFSLSEEGDLLSQWRGYCPPGAGYALGFEAAELRSVVEPQGCWLARCEYDHRVHTALVQEALAPIIATVPPGLREDEEELKARAENMVGGVFTRLSMVATLIKDPAFREEHEWRLIWLPHGQSERHRYRPGRGQFVPYVPISLEGSGQKPLLANIVLGPMANHRTASNGLIGFLQQEGMPWGQITYSRVPFRNW